MAQIHVFDAHGNPLPGTTVFVTAGNSTDDKFIDRAGHTAFPWRPDVPTYTIAVNTHENLITGTSGQAQYAPQTREVSKAELDVNVVFTLEPPAVSGDAGERLPLHMDGLTIRTSDHAVWRYAGMTAFRLYKRFLDGENIDPLIVNYLTCGGLLRAGDGPNTFRYLASASALFSLPTSATTAGSISVFQQHLSRFGARGECVVLADANPDSSAYLGVTPTARTQAEQQAFLDRVAPELAAWWNSIGELGNECSHRITRVDRGAFSRPAGSILWERGSGQADEPPFSPPWDLVGDHSGRQDDWPRRLPARDIRSTDGPPWGIHCAAIENEPMGCADVDEPGRRSNNEHDFRQFAAHAGMNSNGACGHPDVGLQTTPLTPIQARCMAAFYQGLRFSPPDAQLWPYRRGGLTGPQAPLIAHSDRYDNAGVEVDTAGALRTFCKESPSGEGYSVAIRPGAAWTARPLDGRRIVDQPWPGLVRTQR